MAGSGSKLSGESRRILNKMKIFVTRKIPSENFVQLTASGHEVIISEFDRSLTESEMIEKITGVDVLLCLLHDKIDGEMMDAAGPQLKVISNYAVGYDNIDIEAATQRGIVVTNTPSDQVNESVAEFTWALILSLTKRVTEADESVKRGAYSGWQPDIFLSPTLKGKTLGVIGMGRIGSMVATIAKGFGMKVFYNKRTRDPELEEKLGVMYATLDELLQMSDIVSLHVPGSADTRHMINAQSLSKMKQGSYLVNTARGFCVDEHALVESLRDGKLAGAGLDVFDNEPNVNPELINMENVILTPHIASATKEARADMARLAIGGIINTLNNTMPENIVNKDVWEKKRQ
jgi:glyoxylate reductase